MSRNGSMRERLFSPVGLHAVIFGLLAIAVLVLGTRLVLDWRATSTSNVDAIATRQAQLHMLELQTGPLRGLDKKVELSRAQIDEFYAKRIPPSYSSFAERLGELSTKAPVRLTRVQYTQAAGSGDLSEIRMDAGLSGDYPAIMRFVNGLERSPTFFIIRAMALTGQQSGTVNLRLQVSTWMRPEDAASFPVDAAEPGAAGSVPAAATKVPGIASGAASATPANARSQSDAARAGKGL